MRKAISLSALLSGLMATPLLAGVPAKDIAVVGSDGQVMSVESKGSVEVDRMQELHRRMMAEMQAHMAQVLSLAELPAPGVPMPLQLQFVQYAGPGMEGEGRLMLAPRPVTTEKATYLGVATSAATPVLRDQLKLPRGMGLVVLYVAKDSPAAEAGLQQNDVLEKLDDQALVNSPQLAVLVRAKKPGDTVTLGIIRGGERMKLTAKLGEKELPVLEDEIPGMPMGSVNFPTDDPTAAEAWQHGVRKTVVVNGNGLVTRRVVDGQDDITLTTTKDGNANVVVKDRAGNEIYSGPYTTDEEKAKVPADLAAKIRDLAASGSVVVGGAGKRMPVGTVTRSDGEQEITLTRTDSGQSLIVKDLKTGKVIYDGPANSDADLKELPADVSEKVKALEEKVQLVK